MNIRLATTDDLHTVIDLTRQLATYEKEGDIFYADEEFFLNNVLGDKAQVECYLIENNAGDVVGMGEVFTTLSTYTSTFKLNLQDFYISEPHRGKKYGKAFLKFLSELAKERGCTRICWGVYEWNSLARGLYDKVGICHDDVAVYSMGLDEMDRLIEA